MVLREGLRLPLRWEFSPISGAYGAIGWRWHAYTHTGELAMESKDTFDSFSECEADATEHGYQRPR